MLDSRRCAEETGSERIPKGDLEAFLVGGLGAIQRTRPDVEVEQCSIQGDHAHVVTMIPPTCAASSIVGTITATTSREIRQQLPRVK